MPACSNCGEETDLYYHGFPLCVDCSGSGMFPDHILPEPEKENSSELPPDETPPE
jgi:hypothetical protein